MTNESRGPEWCDSRCLHGSLHGGDEFEEAGAHNLAIAKYREALSMLPMPRRQMSVSGFQELVLALGKDWKEGRFGHLATLGNTYALRAQYSNDEGHVDVLRS